MSSGGAQNVRELRLLRAAEDGGAPFLVLRDEADELVVHALDGERPRVVVGRREDCELVIDWDPQVSRAHACLERVGPDWTVIDDGLSRNGTFVNEERVTARRRLADRDVVRIGHTRLLFRQPAGGGDSTVADVAAGRVAAIPEAQRRVLMVLCRPAMEGGARVAPPTNEEIAAELHLSVQAVKAHLRLLFRQFGIGDLPQNEKRLRLVQMALEGGIAARG